MIFKTGKFFMLSFCHLLIFFQNQLLLKFISGIPSECQTDLIQIRPDLLSGLIWVQTVRKSYQQTTLGDKELICFNKRIKHSFLYINVCQARV